VNTFDIIILILLAFGGILGFNKGLITGFTRFVGKIISIGLAFIFHGQFISLFEDLFKIREIIDSSLSAVLAKVINNRITTADNLLQSAAGQLTSVITDYLLIIFSIVILFIVVSTIINLLISLIITPVAKNLGLINRGGGLAFGLLGSYVVLCLLIGLTAPFLTTWSNGALGIGDSLLFPLLLQGYDLQLSLLSGFSDDILTNSLYSMPLIPKTPF